jgi:hypothetical protein
MIVVVFRIVAVVEIDVGVAVLLFVPLLGDGLVIVALGAAAASTATLGRVVLGAIQLFVIPRIGIPLGTSVVRVGIVEVLSVLAGLGAIVLDRVATLVLVEVPLFRLTVLRRSSSFFGGAFGGIPLLARSPVLVGRELFAGLSVFVDQVVAGRRRLLAASRLLLAALPLLLGSLLLHDVLFSVVRVLGRHPLRFGELVFVVEEARAEA